eukprot:c13326_g1_i1 orf=230-2287(+)
MKRVREDDVAGPHLKRLAASRAKSPGPVRHLTTDDALAYLQEVKDIFKDNMEKYGEFLEVMKDFKAQRIDTAGVTARVKDLFKNHRNLILGFNAFVPEGHKITLLPEDEHSKQQPVLFEQAIHYVDKIKTRFRYDEQVYKAFLEILNLHKKGISSVNKVVEEVSDLFCDHKDLLEEFTYFLPVSFGSAPAILTTAPKATVNLVPCLDEKTLGLAVSRHIHNKEIERDNTATPPTDHKQISEVPVLQHQVWTADNGEMEQQEMIENENDRNDAHQQKRRDREGRYMEQEWDSGAMQQFPCKQILVQNIDDPICKQSDIGERPSATISSLEDKEISKSLQKEFAFFENVKLTLQGYEIYKQFLTCLSLYSEELMTHAELQGRVSNLFGMYPDLIKGFKDFLALCELNESYFSNAVSKEFNLGEGPVLKHIKTETGKERERVKHKDKDRNVNGDQNHENRKSRGRDKFASHLPKDISDQKFSSFSNKDKYMDKPISELDFSKSERCTPSYWHLPKDYTKLVASHRTDLIHAVLNDNLVSVTSGSEDHSFKHMHKNPYEQCLFRCEDDRFELDMLLESNAVAAKHIEELLYTVQNIDAKQNPQICVKDYLTARDIRCVERIYDNYGLDMIHLLQVNMGVSLPIVLSRLKQKQEEWSEFQVAMNKVWADVQLQNYHKSLDHHSLHFKEQR